MSRPFSLNDDSMEYPKLRRDQHRKCQKLIRDNAQFPSIALGLVRDYIKHAPNVRSIQLKDDDTRITIFLKSTLSALECEYSFSLLSNPPIETPTLQ